LRPPQWKALLGLSLQKTPSPQSHTSLLGHTAAGVGGQGGCPQQLKGLPLLWSPAEPLSSTAHQQALHITTPALAPPEKHRPMSPCSAPTQEVGEMRRMRKPLLPTTHSQHTDNSRTRSLQHWRFVTHIIPRSTP